MTNLVEKGEVFGLMDVLVTTPTDGEQVLRADACVRPIGVGSCIDRRSKVVHDREDRGVSVRVRRCTHSWVRRRQATRPKGVWEQPLGLPQRSGRKVRGRCRRPSSVWPIRRSTVTHA